MTGQPSSEVTVGTIVACFLQEYSDEEPQLGRVLKVDEERENCNYEIEWLVGSYSETWSIWKQKKGREYVTWKEVIPNHAVLFPVTLTGTERLPSSLVSKLKRAYKEKRTQSQT